VRRAEKPLSRNRFSTRSSRAPILLTWLASEARVEAGYDRLSRLDESFLSFETAETPMHIALTGIFSNGGLATKRGGIDATRIRKHVESRLHLVPRYRQRLHLVPMLHDTVWVDDDAFEIGYHVRHTSLPRPGSEAQLRTRCAEILERPLDRKRPLWEMWVIEGLEGARFALIFKVHHCMVDGVGGVELLVNLLTMEPQGEVPAPLPWQPRPALTDAGLLGSELMRRGRSLADFGRKLSLSMTDPEALGRAALRRAGAVWSLASGGLRPKPATPVNGPIGPHRRIEWMSLSLGEIKEIRDRLGGTVNDIVLATIAGGLRRFLADEDVGALKVACPVNVRGPSEGGKTSNMVSAWILSLSLREPDARRRLAVIQETTAELKRTSQADGAKTLLEAAEWTGAAVLHAAIRMISSRMPVNLVVTNVPGPPFPLYLLSAKLESAYPFLPLFESQGLGIALFRYQGELYIGLTGEWDLLARIDQLPAALEEAFAELRMLAGKGGAPRRPAALARAPSRGTPARHRSGSGSIAAAPGGSASSS
jgi:diacylglycerol O-acyltransferase / wax synthase